MNLCSKTSRINNFDILNCLQYNFKSENDISSDCQNFLWDYKRNLTTDYRFDSAASQVCLDTLNKMPDCARLQPGTGQIISCLIENKDNVTDGACKQFLTKMAGIVFSDFRLISNFVQSCDEDIIALKCGRIGTVRKDKNTDPPHSQGSTIKCLSGKISSANEKCKQAILRIAELQGDDFHLDRPLFYACRDDRERFCSRVKSGGGEVYKCLSKHKFDREMSTECKSRLTARQKLIRQDYKVSKTFSEACRVDIRNNKCTGEHLKGQKRHIRMSIIVRCLESAYKIKRDVSPECLAEMQDYRRSLMQDYQISPEVVTDCASELKNHCDNGFKREGKTIHCLMDLARPRKYEGGKLTFSTEITKKCLRALKGLMREADVAEDYRIDPTLHAACHSVVQSECKGISPGDSRIMNCLLDHIGSDKMNEECEERLLEVQYFMARDWKLSPRLYRKCSQNAKTLCGATDWTNLKLQNYDEHLLTFSCLYSNMKNGKLERECAMEVKRVMRQRAVSVEMEPRIEEPCMKDLAEFCSENVQKGNEIECLQDHLEDLADECRSAVGNFTEDEDMDPELDRILIKACTPMIKKFCDELMSQDDTEPGDVMECLIRQKHHPKMNKKCRAGVEHHQLISMKGFKFTYQFKEACKLDVIRNCQGHSKKKSDVIVCLSEVVRNDTLYDRPPRISRECRQKLKFELFQRSENIQFDPKLRKGCAADQQKFCSNVVPGSSAVLECLKKHQQKLSDKCHRIVFKRQKVELVVNNADYQLMTQCKSMIKIHCSSVQSSEILNCLKKHKDQMDFDVKCRKVVYNRLETKSHDYRFNPQLMRECKLDIPKFCRPIINKRKKDTEMEGEVINCLKLQLVKKMLSPSCETRIKNIIMESSLHYKQDPVLAKACREEILTMCPDKLSDGDESRYGGVEECLKNKFKQHKIKKRVCQDEVMRLLSESKVDIHIDALLFKACSLDVQHLCHDVLPGEGRQMSCLLSTLEEQPQALDHTCKKMLQERVDMWEYAAKLAPPETLKDVAIQLNQSPSRQYFIAVIFAVIGFIFIGGLFCGRVTKRVRAEVKNK
ncbi:Golgi apparatus protein 1-like isoform X2 [Tubulanus polymorphus]|uniref:Golgi apparatus protein 1-like isoform X2 n=1 Tax=Tubulanus polymorphus TaxID=672921 RepID=UPI003DA488D8